MPGPGDKRPPQQTDPDYGPSPGAETQDAHEERDPRLHAADAPHSRNITAVTIVSVLLVFAVLFVYFLFRVF